jgi:hypothetical protein
MLLRRESTNPSFITSKSLFHPKIANKDRGGQRRLAKQYQLSIKEQGKMREVLVKARAAGNKAHRQKTARERPC